MRNAGPVGASSWKISALLGSLLAASPASALVPITAAGRTNLQAVLRVPGVQPNPEFLPDDHGVNAVLVDPSQGYDRVLFDVGGSSLVDTTAVPPGVLLNRYSGPVAAPNGNQFGGGGITAFPVAGPGPAGGIMWFPYLLDDGNQDGTASAVFSTYTVTLQNQSPFHFFNVPGAFVLALRGFVPTGSYVAAAIRGSIGFLTQDVTFASDGLIGPLQDFVWDNQSFHLASELLTPTGTFFEAYGVSLVGPFFIPSGGFIVVSATVSLLADPGAHIESAPLPPSVLAQIPPGAIRVALTSTPTCTTDADCDDGDPCTTESCGSAGGVFTCSYTSPCDDGNPCTDDSCSSAGGGFVCGHMNNAVPCDDGNRCTDHDTCVGGSCLGAPDLTTCQFQCYEVKPSRVAGPTVSLVDRFGSASSPVQRPERLCAPADVNDDDPPAPYEPVHLEGYRVRSALRPGPFQRVIDQFGTLYLDVVRLDRLLVPTAKSLVAPPPAPVAPIIDHFDCYTVRKARNTAPFSRRTVTVEDQFGTRSIALRKPSRLCFPVDKNGEAPGAAAHANALLCYKTAPSMFGTLTPFTNNQFGPGTPTLIHRTELCVSAAAASGAFACSALSPSSGCGGLLYFTDNCPAGQTCVPATPASNDQLCTCL